MNIQVSMMRMVNKSISCAQVGSPFAGRVHPATRGMVGCCMNTLSMRARIASAGTLRGLLAQARATALAAYQHADAPLHSVMHALGRTYERPLFLVGCLPLSVHCPHLSCRVTPPTRPF